MECIGTMNLRSGTASGVLVFSWRHRRSPLSLRPPATVCQPFRLKTRGPAAVFQSFGLKKGEEKGV